MWFAPQVCLHRRRLSTSGHLEPKRSSRDLVRPIVGAAAVVAFSAFHPPSAWVELKRGDQVALVKMTEPQ